MKKNKEERARNKEQRWNGTDERGGKRRLPTRWTDDWTQVPLDSHNPQHDDGDQEAIILITVTPARVVPGSIKDINILASKASRISPGRL